MTNVFECAPSHDEHLIQEIEPTHAQAESIEPTHVQAETRTHAQAATIEPPHLQGENNSPVVHDLAEPTLSIDPISTQPPISDSHPMITRSKHGIFKPNPKYGLMTSIIPTEPKTVKSALKHAGWKNAMVEEMDALMANNIWELVPPNPQMNIVGCCWVFKTKLPANGGLERLKVQLVAKGYNKKEGADFSETFSPVIKPSIVRMVLSVATSKVGPFDNLM